jgi:uncharacterized caspase-like protein
MNVRILLALGLSLALSASSAWAERASKLEPAGPAPNNNERRTALVIGNSAYKSAPLRNPVNDARAIAQLLSEVGFSVTLLEDATEAGMIRAIRNFGDDLLRGGVGLFYYAGHGMQVRGTNYLIPVGADIQREDEVEYQAVDADRVLSKMESAKNGLNIVILDACRNNPFARSFRSSKNGLAEMNAPTGTLIAFATAPGSVAADGDGDQGLYAKHLLPAIREPGLQIERLFKQVRIAVTKDTGDRQVPWESSSLKGDFYFIRPDPRNTAEGRRQAQQDAVERALKDADARAAREREALLKKAAEERAALERKMQALIAQMLAQKNAENQPRPAAITSAPTETAPTVMSPIVSTPVASAPITGVQTPAPAAPPKAAEPASPIQVAIAAPPAALGPAGPGGLRPGDRWEYAYKHTGENKVEKRVFEVNRVAEDLIVDRLLTEDDGPRTTEHQKGAYVNMAAGMQFAPYFLAFAQVNPGETFEPLAVEAGTACPGSDEGRSGSWCQAKALAMGGERITVPAGSFETEKFAVFADGGVSDSALSVRGHFWLSSTVGRIVKARVSYTSSRASFFGTRDTWTETMELVSYRRRGK